ncbi:MAG: hypothetical protein U5K38_14655 [Woeseiaceae bacterium]|nr:hypothetical protein [Woeseiaceae bacterium]
MSSERSARHLPILASIIIALMLAISPFPDALQPFRPTWVVAEHSDSAIVGGPAPTA